MAPKKAFDHPTGSRSRRKTVGTKRNRSDRPPSDHDSSSSSENHDAPLDAQPNVTRKFVSDECRLRYDALKHRSVLDCSYLDRAFFTKIKAFNLVSLLNFHGLLDFVCINEPIVPEFVVQFYSNLRIDYNGTIPMGLATMVNGTFFTRDVYNLKRLFGWKSGDIFYENTTSFQKYFDLTPDQVHERMFQTGIPKSKLPSSGLKFKYKLISYLLNKCIRHAKSGKDYVSWENIFYAYALCNEMLIDTPRLFLSHIAQFMVIKSKNTYLPYGSVLTTLFKHQGFLLSGQILRTTKNSILGQRSLHQMHIKFHENGNFWTWNGVQVTGLQPGLDHETTYDKEEVKSKGKQPIESSSQPPRKPKTVMAWMAKLFDMFKCESKRNRRDMHAMHYKWEHTTNQLNALYQANPSPNIDASLFLEPPHIPPYVDSDDIDEYEDEDEDIGHDDDEDA